MNLAPIYELKSQLRAAMIAGTNLLSEDFRLKKAAENFAPLGAASPVFAKINEMTNSLFTDGSPQNLLDTITLVDAVITTLGTVEVKHEIEEIETTGGGEILSVPYSRLSAVIDSLTTTGSGNFNTFREIAENSPELLRDYRVRPALVTGMGASYGELAELVSVYAEKSDKSLIPLLKRGFDPKGKKEMVRRVNVIESLSGAEENAFYLEQLENAEKDVRKALIYALRHDVNNADKLIELAKTEKGKLKEAAFAALASFDCEKSAAFFEEYSKKKPVDVLKTLEYASSEWSSKLAARLFEQTLTVSYGSKVRLSQIADGTIKMKYNVDFDLYISALEGKFGAEIEKIYREYNSDERIDAIDNQLGDVIIRTNNEDMKRLALELNNANNTMGQFVYAEAVTRLLSGEDCSKWVEEEVRKVYTSVTEKAKKKPKPKKPSGDVDELSELNYLLELEMWENAFDSHKIYTSPIIEALDAIIYVDGEYRLAVETYNHITEKREVYQSKPLNQPIRGAISDTLIKYPTCELSSILSDWIELADTEYCKKLEDHFIEQGTTKSPTGGRGVLLNLHKLNVKNVKGLALKYMKNHSKTDKWDIRGLFNCINGDDEYKFAEAKEVYEEMCSGKLKTALTKKEIEEFWSWAEKEYG